MHATHITTRKMSMQQIIEMLAKAKADRKSDKEESRQANQVLLTRMETKMDANQKKTEADKEEMLARTTEEIKSSLNATGC
jgi:hypothetical protein